MKAAVINNYGSNNDVIEFQDCPRPHVPPDSVLIEVHSASVNPIDNILRAGTLKNLIPLKFPFIMGNDVSGVVVEVGNQVRAFKVGDEVFARPNSAQSGTFAEYVAVKEMDIALKPSSLPHNDAASIPLAALTAWQALIEKAKLRSGQKVLIHAGSGGVGSMAIQIAKHLGAYVATTTSTQNVEWVRSLGADQVIDYKKEQFHELLHDFDVVLDTLAGPNQAKSFLVLKKGGCLVAVTGTPTAKKLADECGVRFELFFMRASGDQLFQIVNLISKGTIKSRVDRIFPFEQVREALDYSLTGRTRGKVVVQIKP